MVWSVQWLIGPGENIRDIGSGEAANSSLAVMGRDEAVQIACDMLAQGHRVLSIQNEAGETVAEASEIATLCRNRF